MIGLEIEITGGRRLVVPADGAGLTLAGVHAGERIAGSLEPGTPRVLEDYIELNVSRVTDTEHLTWLSMQPLELGAEVRMRIVEVEACDEPTQRSPKSVPQ